MKLTKRANPLRLVLALALAAGQTRGTTIAPTFTCNTFIQSWIGQVSSLPDMANAANAAISAVCAGNDPTLCKTTTAGLVTCSATVPVIHCTGCAMLASYTFSSASPPASCLNDLQFIAVNCIEAGHTAGFLNMANGTITYVVDADVF